VVSNDPITESPLNKMPVFRNDWGTVKIKNDPYNYAKLGGDRYRLYNILSTISPTRQINIKLVSDYETIIGYFGFIDCKLSEDKNTITVQPTILDQHSPFIENYEKEIKLYEGQNAVLNGEFISFVGNDAVGWSKTTPSTETYPAYFKEKTAIRIPSVVDLLGNTGINQTFPFVNKGKNITLILQYLLIGTSNVRENLKFKCHLQCDVNSYDLTETGKWIAYDSGYKATYKKAAVALDTNSVNEYMTFSLVSEAIPETGVITFFLFHEPGFDSDLYFSKVRLELSTIQMKTISVNLNEETLVTLTQDKTGIEGIRENYFDNYFRTPDGTRNWDSSLFDCDDYFSPDGTPNQGYLSAGDTALKSLNKLTYSDLINIMDNDQNSSFYQGEMSELTVLRGMYFKKNLVRRRMFYGQAKFTREEVRIVDTLDENNNLIPPQVGLNWKSTQDVDLKGYRLWVRKPYNGAISTWVLGTKEELGEGQYHAKITSVRNYPLTSNTIQYNTCVDLRDLIKQIYQSTDDSLIGKNVYSTFFWNDSQTEEIEGKIFPDGNTDQNYVSGVTPNPLNNILALHTSDLIEDNFIDEEKSVLKISGGDFFKDLRLKFRNQIYFYVDSYYDLHIEHVKFFEKTRLYKNLVSARYDYIPDYREFEFIKEEMFSLERYNVSNSGYQDFKTTDVTFEKIVSNKRKLDVKYEETITKLSTDLQYCIENAANLDNGIVLIAYDVVDEENISRYGIGQKTGKLVLNGDLSLSSLIFNYGRYAGTYKSGQINGTTYNFENTSRTKKGVEITIKDIVSENEIKTLLGNGTILSKTKDYDNENTKVTLAYPFEVVEISNGDGEILDTGNANNTILALPIVSTGAVTVYELYEEYNIILNCESIDDGDSAITEKGICFSTSLNPTIADTKNAGIPSTGIGTYIGAYAGLSSGYYYLRAYATNSVGTAYGNSQTFIIP